MLGCRCYAHVQERARDGKLVARTVEADFFGYYDMDNVFAVFDVNAKKLLKRRDVVFHEDVLGHPSLTQFGLQPGFDILGNTIEDTPLDIMEQGEDGEEVVLVTIKPTLREVAMATLISSDKAEPGLDEMQNEVEVRVIEMTADQPPPSDDRSAMIEQFENLFKRMAVEYEVVPNPLIETAQDEIPPKSFSLAMRSTNKSFWFHALVAEMRSLLDKGTFGLVSPLDIPSER